MFKVVVGWRVGVAEGGEGGDEGGAVLAFEGKEGVEGGGYVWP
jgi:hypothetical protein